MITDRASTRSRAFPPLTGVHPSGMVGLRGILCAGIGGGKGPEAHCPPEPLDHVVKKQVHLLDTHLPRNAFLWPQALKQKK